MRIFYKMTLWSSTKYNDFPTDQILINTPMQDIDTEFNINQTTRGFHGAFALDVWHASREHLLPRRLGSVPVWDLHMLFLLRPVFRNFHFVYLSVLLDFTSRTVDRVLGSKQTYDVVFLLVLGRDQYINIVLHCWNLC